MISPNRPYVSLLEKITDAGREEFNVLAQEIQWQTTRRNLMSMSHRVQKIRSQHQSPLTTHSRPAIRQGRGNKVESVFLVARRPPLAEHPLIWRWLARWIYRRIHWTPDYGIEYQGIFDNESAARHAASGPGMFYMELPFNAELPRETAQYGKHDFPLSEASQEYRKRKLPLVVVPRSELEHLALLEAKIEQTFESTKPVCMKVECTNRITA